MKIRKIEISNFRSLENITIYPTDILALVGRNNSGKSNILKAIKLFFKSSTKLVDDECFYNHCTDNPIKIFITFEDLSNWEKEKFAPWMIDDDKLIVGRIITCDEENDYSIDTYAIVKIPEIEWLDDNIISGKKISEWWANRDQLKLNDLDFGAVLGNSKPGVAEWKEHAREFLEDNKDEIPWKIDKRKNPTGYPGVLKGALPEFIHIPAIRDISDEAKVGRSNPFGQLINSVLAKISEKHKKVISDQLKEIEKKLNRSEEGERIAEIKNIEDRLNAMMSELMSCDIEIEMPMPELKNVFGEAKIYADDGVRTIIDTKGHGMQRSMILTILRAYAELTHIQKAEEKAEERTTIFAIEEPELYLHPQSQRTLMSVFQQINNGKDQIIYTTHSSLFVDISYFDQICIMRRERKNGDYKSYPSQLSMTKILQDLKVRKGVDGTEEGIREQYSNTFNPMINEGFFADKVVIVEGPSEQYALPIYSDAIGYNLDRNNISVVHSNGKGQMDRLFRVFNGFKIPTYLWFDGDKNKRKENIKRKTLDLLNLLGNPIKDFEEIETIVSDSFTVLENNFEDTLKDDIDENEFQRLSDEAEDKLGPHGKPLKHRYIATKLKENSVGESAPDDLPDIIVEIVDKIKQLEYSGCILQDLED